jgi:hypothetical protein
MVERRLSVGRPGIIINRGWLSGLNKLFPEENVGPQIRVGGVFGELEYRQA